MQRFHVIDDAAVILRARGVYKQVKVYRRGEAAYAGYSGGFIRLYANGGTSFPNVSWEDIDVGDIRVSADSLSHMVLS